MAHYLNNFFQPHSIAVIGASDRANSVGTRVFRNLLKGNFNGKLYAINPKHKRIQDQLCYASLDDIQEPIDLAVITTPNQTVPAILDACGQKQIRSAVIISSGFSETGEQGKALEAQVANIAAKHHIRLIGPNCLGIMCPHINMNATFDNNAALPGGLALVSQSGAICAAILDWAINKKIGFSSLISLGNSIDVDFGDILNYLAIDTKTKSILLYIEGVKNARRFMSGLRAAARIKPVIVIKGGINQQGSRAALSHTGAIIGNDDVFDAALKQAGVVRVATIEELFFAAEILSGSIDHIKGNRLIIITNGGGAGVMAADHAAKMNVSLPDLTQQTIHNLDKVLPAQWSHHNPIDIIGDAPPERYHSALDICTQENVDGLLTILVPVSMSNPLSVAKQVIADAKKSDKLIFACWMGEKQVKSSWKLFEENNIPYFDTPEKAISAFSYLADYFYNQQMLMQIPKPFLPEEDRPDIKTAQAIIDNALAEGRTVLTAIESKQILKSFLIPIAETKEANTKEQAITIARQMGYPLVMKINSPDISHKQEAKGVALNITNEETVQETFDQLIANAKEAYPQAKILGVTLEPMIKSQSDRELMIGIISDNVFGPVISFGSGGTFVEINKDRALAIPPLNRFLSECLIDRTRIAKALGHFRNMPPVNKEAIIRILLRVSAMICALPAICEMDINPIIANEKNVIAVDARIVVKKQTSSEPYYHMAIHPYPDYLISSFKTENKEMTLRPIRPEDAELEQDFIHQLSDQSKYFRFMESINELSQTSLVRFTQIDYDREMAMVVTYQENGKENMIGIARYVINTDGKTAEFAIVVSDAWHSLGIGSRLIAALINIAKDKGIQLLEGAVLASNAAMLALLHQHGFFVAKDENHGMKLMQKILKDDAE